MKDKSKVIVIVGPTSSGKSDLAVKLAREFDGEVISADSRQVYEGLDIGSGKVTKAEMKSIPHHMLSVAKPVRKYTVSQYKRAAKRVLKDILKRDKLPIIVGGTGMYIDALVYDIDYPKVRPDEKLRKSLERKSVKVLYNILYNTFPERAEAMNESDRANKRRLIRAIEVARALGSVPKVKKGGPYDPLWLGLKVPEDKLVKRIEKRLRDRLKRGLLAEVKRLRKTLSWQRLFDLGLEYRYASLYLRDKSRRSGRDKITKEEMAESIVRESRKYAKRQMRWWRNNQEINWVKNYAEAKRLAKDLLRHHDWKNHLLGITDG